MYGIEHFSGTWEDRFRYDDRHPSAFDHIVAQLSGMAAKLEAATTSDEKHALLREYRTLLEEADRSTKAG